MDEFDWVKTHTTLSSYGTLSDILINDPKGSGNHIPARRDRGSFASFICHVFHLERSLRALSPILLDNLSNVRVTDKILGQGKTFLVREAFWIKDRNDPPIKAALKEIIPIFQPVDARSSNGSSQQLQNDWNDILFEIRALLHEPIRYHPNLVRLLGIRWGVSPLSESTYPQILMECSPLGTLKTLQSTIDPLPFRTKQTLCYDVGRGLSALHASGIVHGDMKHENVLIFPRSDETGVKYVAKLADFGGSVMDMTSEEFRKVESWTWPFQAPEWESPLSREGMKLTDVYSFGLLIWRLYLDGEGFISMEGAAPGHPDESKQRLADLKETEEFTQIALRDISEYSKDHGIPETCSAIISYAILHTVRTKPSDRSLVKAQVALRGIKLGKVETYLHLISEKNAEKEATENRRAPGRHGITPDSLAFMLGRYGENVDLQNNLPGYRPRLEEPTASEFIFEPDSLKSILTWEQQRQMVEEFKEVALLPSDKNKLLDLKRTVAAFYLFQCYLQEFGVVFNAEESVKWLSQASSDDDSHEDEDYLSQAWLWRISRALGQKNVLTNEKANSLLRLSVFRGHRTALQDLLYLASNSTGVESENWRMTYWKFRGFLHSDMGAVGMGYFFTPRMTKSFNLDDIAELDEQIRNFLGDDYQACLKTEETSTARLLSPFKKQWTGEEEPIKNAEEPSELNDTEPKSVFDKIYLNIRGHGLLHYAAAMGRLNALQHMVNKYKCNVNLPNQHVDEPPLVCAAYGGKLDCVMFLLDHGADPNGYRHGQEGPLHWLCSFQPNEMAVIASRLVRAGADIELRSGGMRHDVRGIRADWEHLFEIHVTPLGRAVLMNNVDAVKVLLKLGANPLAQMANKHKGEEFEGSTKVVDVKSPFELAAILTLPDILAEFIQHIDGAEQGSAARKLKLIDEAAMLDLAHKKIVTPFDPLTLQSRLVRCGMNYKSDLKLTVALLKGRALPWNSFVSDDLKMKRSQVLCKEVALGNVDIVECLLEFGYDPNGTKGFRPVEKAIELNHEELFFLLVRHKVDLTVMRTTPEGLHLSLLHLCGSRPYQSRPGSAIARHLIASKIPVESVDAGSKSPLSIAISNQNFDVATALLENGADVDAMYPVQFNGAINGLETRVVNVLVEVLAEHTTRTLESLKFLFGKKEGGPHKRPGFILDKSNEFSVLHLLGGSKHFTEVAQITPSIVDLCLDAYSEPECLNYRHPVLGTPVYYAAMNGHKPMVERLLRRGADTSSNAGPDMSYSVNLLLRPKETWTPLWAGILRYDEEINRCILFPEQGFDPRLKSNLIQNLEKIVNMLAERNGDELAREAMKNLLDKKKGLLAKFERFQEAKRISKQQYKEDPNVLPLDLNILGLRDEKFEKAIADIEVEDWKLQFSGFKI